MRRNTVEIPKSLARARFISWNFFNVTAKFQGNFENRKMINI